MTENKHKIPKSLWKTFTTGKSKRVFNEMMDQSLGSQDLILHPNTKPLPKEEWKTICWNMACHAAWSVRDDKKKEK